MSSYGFNITGKDNSEVILAGGGTKPLNEFVAASNTGISGVWVGTQSAYDSITTKSETILYIIK